MHCGSVSRQQLVATRVTFCRATGASISLSSSHPPDFTSFCMPWPQAKPSVFIMAHSVRINLWHPDSMRFITMKIAEQEINMRNILVFVKGLLAGLLFLAGSFTTLAAEEEPFDLRDGFSHVAQKT